VAVHRIVSIQTTGARGGAEYANVDLLDALAARGHEVLLVTNLPDLADGTRVPVLPISLGPKLNRRSVVRVVAEAPLTLLRLGRALRRAGPVGCVLLHFKKEQLLCALLPRSLTGDVVWMEWGPVPPAMRRGLPRWLYALAARRARRILAVSEGTRRSVVAAGAEPAKVVVVPNLVDVGAVRFDDAGRERLRAEWGAREATFVIGLISRLQRRKRNDVVVDAMASLDGDVLLVVAGEGEEEAALRARAAALPAPGRVRFVGNVRGEVETFLSACDVLVFAPSPTEGEPRVIVMAQLVGVPVVATHGEGARDLIAAGAGAIVSPSHDAPALARTLEAYRVDPGRRASEAAAAREARRASHDPQRTLATVERALGLG